MFYKKHLSIYLFIFAFSYFSFAHIPPKKGNTTATNSGQTASYRSECNTSTAQMDLKINNVRARLKTAGDFWWDNSDAGYIVPKVELGEEAVASIFAGGLWFGGLDQGGNLKTACQTYGSATGDTDFWPGPLAFNSDLDPDLCTNWDRFFSVTKTSIDLFRANWAKALSEGRTELEINEIPLDVAGWPANGNPFFEDIHGFPLKPDNSNFNNAFAEFWDEGGIPGVYEPQFGDYPILHLWGCDEGKIVPDQMVFSIINDGSGDHTSSKGDAILMEVQSTAFAFKTTDEINDMTFYKYLMINKAIEEIDSTYIGIWMDPDLGCYTDDYIGCDVERSLAYAYNSDALDGNNDCEDCPVATYCTDIPVVGIDFFRGPLNENGEELGMSSFTYYDNPSFQPNNALVDPQEPVEYYRYLTGSWRDGTPMSYGGSGYSPSSPLPHYYAFTDPPNDPMGWSMCSANISPGDFRTVQAAGPFNLLPGAINEMITGVVWVPSIVYPCPDLSRFFAADDKAQFLFDNCFENFVSDVFNPVAFDPIKIFPNPYSLSSGAVLNIEALPAASTVSIFDITGRLLKTYTGETHLQLDLGNDLDQASPGTYVVQVKTEEFGSKAFKLLLLE